MKNKLAYFTLHEDGKKLDMKVEQCLPHNICISADGYGDYCTNDGEGTPLLIEMYEGKLRVVTWADINQEDSTHIINMQGALESNRKEEDVPKKEPKYYEGSVKFDKEEEITIHEIARMGLAMCFDEIGEELDLSDEVLKNLQEKLDKEGNHGS